MFCTQLSLRFTCVVFWVEIAELAVDTSLGSYICAGGETRPDETVFVEIKFIFQKASRPRVHSMRYYRIKALIRR